jgi:hypothetical protein
MRRYYPQNPIVRKLWARAADLDDRIRSYGLTLEEAVTKFVQPLGDRGARSHEAYAANRLRHNPEARAVEFTITSLRRPVDRDGDRVEIRGIDWTDWERSRCPILWGHMNDHPAIGTGLSAETGKAALTITDTDVRCWFRFDADDFSDLIYQKVLSGSISGASMAFIPRKAVPIRDQDGKHSGWSFREISVTEVSVVNVAANADSVAMANDKRLSPMARRAARREALVTKSLANLCSCGWDNAEADELAASRFLPEDIAIELADLRNRVWYELRRQRFGG